MPAAYGTASSSYRETQTKFMKQIVFLFYAF